MKSLFRYSAILYLAGLLALIALVALACNLPSLESPARSTSILTPIAPSPSPEISQQSPTEEIRTKPTIDREVVDPQCVKAESGAKVDFEGELPIQESILRYVNSGATSEELARTLEKVGVDNEPTAVLSDDMTGDGKNEIVVSIYDPASKNIPPAGRLLILVCRKGQFVLELDEPTPETFGGPRLWYLRDLDADWKAELVYSLARCGAHTCFERVRILAWVGEGFENRLEGDTMELPYPVLEVRDLDDNAVFDIEISGTGIGSAGAGPPRGETWVYSYDREDDVWRRMDAILSEAKYRVHVLHDADSSAQAGEYQEALIDYQRVNDDPSLLDWIDPETEKANLKAYSRFKMLVLFSILDQESFAETIYQEMVSMYSPDSPQHAYLQMAEEFKSQYSKGNIAAACQAVNAYAADHPDEILAPLNSFGYGNPDFTPEDICPFENVPEPGG